MTTGSEPNSAPAISDPHSKTSPRTSSVKTPTGMVLFYEDWMKVSA